MSVDLRTRSDLAPPQVAATALLARDLPAAFERLGDRAAEVATRTHGLTGSPATSSAVSACGSTR